VPSLALTVCLGLAAAAPARAAENWTHLQVTSPQGTYMIDDEVSGGEAITVTGSSNLVAGSKVDINCYSGSTWTKLVEGVEVNSAGSFAFGGFLHSIADETCVLRAVPHSLATNDYPPSSPSRFTGPTLAIGQRYDRTVTSGPNAGKLKSQYLYASQLLGAFDYGTLGDCSIIDSYTYNPITFANSPLNRLDACNAFLWWENGRKASGFAPATRSDLQVDGADAFLPGNIASLFAGAESLPGFPVLSDNYSIEPGTGNLVLEEGQSVVRCSPGGAFPPTAATCTSLVPTGIQAYLKITQTASGRVSSVIQYFEAADGHPHQIDVLDDNEFFTPREDGLIYFPWLTPGFQGWGTAGQVLAGPPASPSTFYVKATGSEGVAGAVTLASAPENITVVGTTDNSSETSRLNLHYRRTVPAGQYVALGFSYANGFALSEVEANAAAAQAGYVPHVAISTPASATTTSQSTVTLSGTAGDASGLASVTVAGQRAALNSSGAWSATVSLNPGQNTITAGAANIFGNTASAQVTITYKPVPPKTTLKLVGKPAPAATGVTFTVRCLAPVGVRCSGAGALVSQERLHAGRLVGVIAKRHRRPRPPKQVVVGTKRFSVGAGARMQVLVALDRQGLRLLSRFGRLPVRLAVESSGATSSGSHAVGSGRLRLRALRTSRIARSIRELIRSARHIRASVSCPVVVVKVRGGRFTCTATGSTGRGHSRKRFNTPFAVLETDSRGDVRYHS
jgi:hypothetical protein